MTWAWYGLSNGISTALPAKQICQCNLSRQPLREALLYTIANTIYRVTQEALTNVARHAHATKATVELKAERSVIQLRIEDDGIGFDPVALPASASGGIIGMQERINLLGGTMQIQSSPVPVPAWLPIYLTKTKMRKNRDGDDNHSDSR